MSGRHRRCGHCGTTDVGGYAAGAAAVGGIALCHPNEAGRPDCYRLVTVYRHPAADRGARCPCDGTLAYWPDGVEPGAVAVPGLPF